MSLAQSINYDAVSDYISPRQKRQTIIDEAAARYGVNPADIIGRKRGEELATARFEVYTRMRNEMNLSYPQIGRSLKRDHTTIIHGVKRFAEIAAKAEAAQ